MKKYAATICAVVLAGCIASSAGEPAAQTSSATGQQKPKEKAQSRQPGPPGTFRVRVNLVPVDVIVTDKNGKPVRDLKKEDFTILENGRPQQIQHFSIQNLAATSPAQAAAAAPEQRSLLRKIPTAELASQSSRIFLLLLGRGRHQANFKSVDALVRFVRRDLLPQDRVAVFAYNRATDFTTDHEMIAQVLERYKKIHERIESWFELQFRGLAAVYGSKEIPKSYQGEIDKIFNMPEGLASRRLPPGRITAEGNLAQDTRQTTDALQRIQADQIAAEVRGGDPELSSISPFDRLEADAMTDLPFEEYVSTSVMTHLDLQNIFTAIEYLRYMEGEKHLVFFTSDGLFLPRADYDKGVAAVANDARVAIDTFQTGGVYLDTSGFSAAEPGPIGRNPAAGRQGMFKLGSTSRTWALSSLRQISQLTGGLASINEDIGRSLTQLNNVTRVEYLLGYYPRNTNWNGEYRRIAVKVNRPDLKVSYRHGYYANDTLKMYDREEFLAYSRISAAAAYGQDIADVPFKIITSRVQDEADHSQVRVDLQIDPTRVRFRTANNLHTGKLHIAIFSTDERGRYLGDISRTMDMNLREETYQRVMKSAIPFSILIPYQVPKQILKIVVYDCGSDKIGSLIQQMR